MAVVNNDLSVEFFEEYRNSPELWNSKSNSYKNKDKINKSLLKMLEVYKKIDGRATMDSLKNKIHNIRTCYRRELKKLIESEQSGAGAEDIYVPALWYFDILHFLKDNEIPMPGTSTVDSGDEIEEIEIQELQPKRKKKTSNKEHQEFLKTAVNHLNDLKKDKDEAHIFSEGWSLSFRKLSETQKLYAKKAIDEIFILGQLNQLSLHTVPTSATCSGENSPLFLTRSSTPSTSSSVLPSGPVVLSNSVISNASHNSDSQNCIVYNSFQDLFSDSQYT